MRKYYLQIYHQDGDSQSEAKWAGIDDLPYQPLLIERMAAIGIIEPKDKMLSAQDIERVNRILRIRNVLGVNLSGAAIIIELMDRMEDLEEEINRRESE
jgi:MerR family transcriptional regulator/heat shock protein HspR